MKRTIQLIMVCSALISLFWACGPNKEKESILKGKDWEVRLDKEGHITHFQQGEVVVPFRSDSLAGPAFEGITLSRVSDHRYVGERDGITYSLTYRPAKDHLTVTCKVCNHQTEDYAPSRLRFHLGVDAEMHTFPQWDEKFFPTLLRCEHDFLWGYLMSPLGYIMAIGVEDPVASYQLNYRYEGIKEWEWGHQIYTESFDFLHQLPLPDRHPQDQTMLKAGETKSWTVHLGMSSSLEDVKPSLSRWMNVPLPEAERYVLEPGEETRVHVFGGKDFALCYDEKGVHRAQARGKHGRQAEVQVYVRQPWLWYLSKARDWAAQYPPLVGGSAEQYYGYYVAALAARLAPDKEKDEILRKAFDERMPLVIDTVTGRPKSKEALPFRIQNFSTMMGILVDYWEATHDRRYLTYASRIGDIFCSDEVQWPDGSYRSQRNHYTAVIYPAKSMMELAMAEREAAKEDPSWAVLAERHLLSAGRAVEDLAEHLDDIGTEGDQTFEDGMITCSAAQMAMYGLLTQDPSVRKRMTEAARYMMDKHRCLEQRLIPDCRMRGATLRFWEALDVYFSPNQVMNSPHGWTAWKMYAIYYLYKLTGEESYRRDLEDTMGACVQVMNLDGHLRWGFIPDPYVDALVCVPRQDNPRAWTTQNAIVGEQYMDLINPWLRPADENGLFTFGECGGSGDGTVYEIFKALTECMIDE